VLLSTVTGGAEAGWLAGGSEEWGPSAGLKFWELQERRNIVSDNAQMYFFILLREESHLRGFAQLWAEQIPSFGFAR